jgi:hypothetical protein
MNETIIALITLMAVIAFLLWFINDQKKHYSGIEKDLLNRIQARNYETFVQGEVIQQPPKPLTPEEIYEQQIERGIPI